MTEVEKIQALIDKHEREKEKALSPSVKETVEAYRALHKSSLLNALQTARLVEAVQTLIEVLRGALESNVCEHDPSHGAVGEQLPDLSGRASIPG